MAALTTKKSRSASHSATSTFKTLGIIFTLVGLTVMGIFIFLMYNESRYDEKYDAVTATITEITSHRDSDGDTSHSVLVAYEYGGTSYDYITLGSYKSSMRRGQELTVYIDPSDPAHPRYPMGFWFFFTFMIFGAVFAAVGILLLVLGLKVSQRKRLVENGQGEAVYATVTSARATSVKVNNMTTYRVIATWDDQYGVTHEYKSEYLYFDPSKYIQEGALIRVYVDPNNYNKYYMCAQELQSEDPEYQQYSGD